MEILTDFAPATSNKKEERTVLNATVVKWFSPTVRLLFRRMMAGVSAN